MNLPSMSTPDLVRLCAESDEPRAWEEFIRRFHPLMATTALRTCRQWGEYSPQVADDLVQKVYVKLCSQGRRLLREFRPEHPDSFCGYLKVLTANHVHDHFKAARSAKRGSGKAADSLDSAGGVAEARHTPRIERGILLHEIEACLAQIAPGSGGRRDRLIFWLYYRHGLTAQEIAFIPGLALTTKGVESVILRLIRQLQLALLAKRGARGAEGMPDANSL